RSVLHSVVRWQIAGGRSQGVKKPFREPAAPFPVEDRRPRLSQSARGPDRRGACPPLDKLRRLYHYLLPAARNLVPVGICERHARLRHAERQLYRRVRRHHIERSQIDGVAEEEIAVRAAE